MIECKKFLGKFRGRVVDNFDLMGLGRLLVEVPDVSGFGITSWAMPSLPVGGMGSGLLSLPLIGSGVWVEFEQGDLDYPIWVGTFWGSIAEVPPLSRTLPPGVPSILMQTPAQNGLLISDVPGPTGGIIIKSATGAAILVNDTGIYIQNGKGASIVMTGNAVNINQGALTIL